MKLYALILAAVVAVGAGNAHAYSLGSEFVEFHGFYTLEYTQATASEGLDRPDAGDPSNGAFDMHHINFLFDIRPLPELVIKTNLEFDHGADTELGHGDIVLEYGFLEYTYRDWLVMRAGKTLTPYGLLNEVHDASPAYLTVFIPKSIYRSAEVGGFGMMPKWNVGLQAQGAFFFGTSHHDLYYAVYVGNGESLASTNASQFDDNTNKAVGGKIWFTTHDESLYLGVSGFYGDRAVTEDQLEETHQTYVLSALYQWEGLRVSGEYGVSEILDREERGWYAQASYAIGAFTPYVRHQRLDPETADDEDHWATTLVGVNIRVNDYLFFKVEYDFHDRGANNNDVINPGDEKFSEFLAALTLFW